MNKLGAILLLSLVYSVVKAQKADSVYSRIIFIGDAGEMDMEQNIVLKHAADKIIQGKTTVMYLGDNIYPRGMGLPGSADEKETQNIMRSQYQPMRAKGAPVYFIPGNHDWDRMGPNGLAKIKRQWEFLEEQGDSLLKLIPANGCPDPVEINVSPGMTIIAFDSEWWLFPYNKENADGACDCNSRQDVLDRLQVLFEKNKDKIILLASHHPFQTYGNHGGYFALKDHIFPLTALNHNLYIPLPGLGSLYPFLRSTFPTPEDTGNPLYREMVKKIDAVFEGFPNLIHVAGHEHGLQFIKNKQVQVVSGAGAKNNYVVKGKHALYANGRQGYVVADQLANKKIKFTYYTETDTGVIEAFEYNQTFKNPVIKTAKAFQSIKEDSVLVKLHPEYNDVNKLHRMLFGENYRKEWAAETKLPVIKLSKIHGGLMPLKIGGGFQTNSLRLVDKNGKEWVLRSVEKSPEKILPEALRETFAKDWVDDAMSAQHPFSALVVPPLAKAAGVPHAVPIIGVVSDDPNLGEYVSIFANKICLLEEREPAGETDNTPKMIKNLDKDNDYKLDGLALFRAKLLDLLVGDWDRHSDQWRWTKEDINGSKLYGAVPRDRDQVFYVNQGILPYMASRAWVAPNLQGFGGKIKNVNYSLWKTNFLDPYPGSQLSYEEWTKAVKTFVAAETDDVLEEGLRKLPKAAYDLRHDQLLSQLKERRDEIPSAMDEYYRFKNEIVDVRVSDKNELVTVNGTADNGIQIIVNKISKLGVVEEVLMEKTFDPKITKEIRLYLGAGSDELVLNNQTSPIKLRVINENGNKTISVKNAKKTVRIYDQGKQLTTTGDTSRLKIRTSRDSTNTAFLPVKLEDVTMPLVNIAANPDDGILLGLGFRRIHQKGFQKEPFNNTQQFFVSHSFTTKAFSIRYGGTWIKAIGKADLQVNATINAPENSVNFFGRGNETVYDKEIGDRNYYRARFSTYQIDPSLKWKSTAGSSLQIGPSLQYYKYNAADNFGRFITTGSQLGSYDSLKLLKNKIYAGIITNFTNDKRSNKIMPSWGSFVNINILGYAGLNRNSESFIQIKPEIAFYKSINTKATIVLAERFGGGVTFGKTAFYQSLFLGGQGNLYGYRMNRFAGQHLLYNNLELRAKIGDFTSYIVPGQVGVLGYYDIGRVWETNENSQKWHNGFGAGLYATAAQYAVLKFIMGYSTEGWYPNLNLGMRF
jgi:hypothetical protein